MEAMNQLPESNLPSLEELFAEVDRVERRAELSDRRLQLRLAIVRLQSELDAIDSEIEILDRKSLNFG